MNRSEQLGQQKISELLWKFSIPAIIGMLVNALYNVVDRVFIGRGVGSLGIAGITVGFPMMMVLFALAMLVGVGATTLISIKLGEQKKDDAEHVMGNAMVLLVVISIIASALGLIFIDPLLKLSGASEAALPYAREYMQIILFGTVFMGIGFGMNNFIRAEGSPKIAMFTMLIGAVLNTILDPIFIFVFGWGMRGAALATILSQLVSAVWVLHYFLSGKSHLKIRVRYFKLSPAWLSRILAIGSAPFALQLASSLLGIILNNSLKHYGGDTAISAMGIINSIMMLMFMPVLGINQGAQPIIGYNYGARKFDRVKKALKLAIIAATGVVTAGFIIVQLFPLQLVTMFNRDDPLLITFSTHALRISMLLLPIIGFQIIGANYFQAIGKPKHAMLLTLSRQVLILLPAVLILPKFFGLEGIIIAIPVADLLASILTAALVYREVKRLNLKHNITTLPQPLTE